MLLKRTFKSTSSDAVYETQLDTDTGESSCNCPGWINKRRNQTERSCKHTKAMAAGSDLPPKAAPAAVPADVPTYVEPMLAQAKEREVPLSQFAASGAWSLEEKKNGRRVQICVGTKGMVLWSRPRAGNAPLPKTLPPHLMEALRQLPPGSYDGEDYVPGGRSSDAARLDRRLDKVVVLWDVMSILGDSVINLPLTERRKLLWTAVHHLSTSARDVVTQADVYDVDQAVVDTIWDRGGEGAMLKLNSARYQPGKRSWDWQKVKKYFHSVLTIVGYDTGLTGPHAVFLLKDDDGFDARCKTQSSHMPADWRQHPDSYIGRRLQIEHQGRTETGGYLHPMHDHLVED